MCSSSSPLRKREYNVIVEANRNLTNTDFG